MTDGSPRPLGPLTDEELVRRYRHGIDPEGAMLELYERYRSLTYGFFRRRIGSPDLAAEENQELYMTVVQHLKGYRGESSFRTWLFQIAHHRLSHLRRRWSVHLDEKADAVPEELWEQLAAPSEGSPELRAARGEVTAALKRCLAALPETERAVVFGQYYGGITLQLLDVRLGLTNRSGSRSLLIAAQRRLRKCLEKAGMDAAAVRGSLEGGSA
jgi:RNA polymerase sigma-70 factor (ECF subfamily)